MPDHVVSVIEPIEDQNDSFAAFLRKVEEHNPRYEREIALARRAAEIQRQTDAALKRQEQHYAPTTYAVNM